jgi:thiol-disulfide isomerase/thioredoxin
MGEASPTPEHTLSVSMEDPVTSSAAPSTADASASAAAGLPDDPLLTMSLTDVRTGEEFTLAELVADGPVFVETMAIWCANCRAQMHEVTAAHELADFSSVSIDVEPAEAAEDLAAYAEREGYDWPFALADAELATELRNRFGTEVLFPPGMPKLLIGADGRIELLPLGELLSASAIAELVEG